MSTATPTLSVEDLRELASLAVEGSNLRAWAVRYQAEGSIPELDPETAGAALGLLTAGLGEEVRVATRELLRAGFRTANRPPPNWLRESAEAPV